MNIDGLITEAKAKFNHNLAKAYLKEKYQSKLIFADQGGLWVANKELITFLLGITTDEVVILDSYENPIKVNRVQLLNQVTKVYTESMNEWYEEFTKLRKQR
jgi:hypothetical protein